MDVPTFWSHVDKAECWVWTASLLPNGYAYPRVDKRKVYAHRLAYELLVGPIPEGLDLDHLCRNRSCCNPEHLEPVTRRVNLRRGRSANGEKSSCKFGHPYTAENTYIFPSSGARACRTCRAEQRPNKHAA